ncbi:MAG: hypothetical protein WC770_05995 [Phycisphaerae bacterium]|jgi:hypothetical protein
MAEQLELPQKNRPAFGGWIMLIFWWAMILCALHASTHMVGAGDTWVAMACGRHFINHGVNTVEPFSANSHKPGPTAEEVKTWPKWAQKVTDIVGLDTVKFWHPTGWVNQNWLTHVFFYWLTHDSPIADADKFDKPFEGQNISYNSLVYWKYAIYIITVIAVYYTGRHLGVNPAVSAVFACFALFVGRSLLDIRPAGFSNMLTAVLLFIFVLTVHRNYLYIWLIVPITVLWCNLHGGYVYVFIVLVPFIGLHLLQILPKKVSTVLLYCLGWLFFYALALKFRGHEYLASIKISPLKDGLFYFILILAGGSVFLARLKNVKPALFYIYHIIGTFIVFIATSSRFYPDGIDGLMRQDVFGDYAYDARRTYFVMFIIFAVVALLLGAFRSRLKTISFKAWRHTVAAMIIAFFAMIVFNPFHLTNLTHTFVVSVSEDAKLWKTVNEWHPAFEWSNPVGDEQPFLYMYILAWLLLAVWVVCLMFKPKEKFEKAKINKNAAVNSQVAVQYQWPTIDLPLLVIAVFTIYMAIGSRRFIPIAAIAACPLMAVFFDSTVKMISALMNRATTGNFSVLRMPKLVQYVFAFWAFAVVSFLSIWWGYWYKTVYLDPWPDSYYLTSEFMRMSASYAKPFRACQFIRDNNLKGEVFNYWTEGGFVAYGQNPDPNTGKTPLQLFMDGRAQAAYNTAAYNHWMYIMGGGDVARNVQRADRGFTNSDYQAIGQWTDRQLSSENVWVVLMPIGQFDSPLVRGLETTTSWLPVFIDDQQKLYVNVNTEQGKSLYIGMFDGRTKFPDDFSKQLTIGTNLLRIRDESKFDAGCDMLIEACKRRPYQVLVVELINAASRNQKARGKISEVLSNCFNDFAEKEQEYEKQNGYRERMVSAMIAAEYLKNINRSNPELFKKYSDKIKEYTDKQKDISDKSRW